MYSIYNNTTVYIINIHIKKFLLWSRWFAILGSILCSWSLISRFISPEMTSQNKKHNNKHSPKPFRFHYPKNISLFHAFKCLQKDSGTIKISTIT